MAERKSRVFLVATANNIHDLAPELLRKGRFDEIFFVDLPDVAQRKALLQYHLARRKAGMAEDDIGLAAACSDGFSGAELEQAVVGAGFRARSAERQVIADDLLNELKATQPLSVVMAEQLQALRLWAQQRCVQA